VVCGDELVWRHRSRDPVGGRNSLHRAISPTRCRRTAGSPGRWWSWSR